jgi:RNA polymerase sigma-70 factor (ECF subfamily)
LHNHADAEEITQDTFLRAHRNLPRFRGESSLATWLHRIAVNLARNRYWYFFRRRRHATLSLDCPIGEDGDSTLAELFAVDAPNPAQEASREEFSALVADCMAKLDAPHREILALRNLQNQSYEEIAQKLGINPGTVKSRIARARERLRARLAEACPEFAPDAAPAEWFEPTRSGGRLTPAWI